MYCTLYVYRVSTIRYFRIIMDKAKTLYDLQDPEYPELSSRRELFMVSEDIL